MTWDLHFVVDELHSVTSRTSRALIWKTWRGRPHLTRAREASAFVDGVRRRHSARLRGAPATVLVRRPPPGSARLCGQASSTRRRACPQCLTGVAEGLGAAGARKLDRARPALRFDQDEPRLARAAIEAGSQSAPIVAREQLHVGIILDALEQIRDFDVGIAV